MLSSWSRLGTEQDAETTSHCLNTTIRKDSFLDHNNEQHQACLTVARLCVLTARRDNDINTSQLHFLSLTSRLLFSSCRQPSPCDELTIADNLIRISQSRYVCPISLAILSSPPAQHNMHDQCHKSVSNTDDG